MIDICTQMSDLDRFPDYLRDVAMATNFRANLGIWVYSAERRLNRACNIAIPIQ